MDSRLHKLRNLKVKFIYDQLDIISNEILNLLSVAVFMKKPITDEEDPYLNKVYTNLEAIVKILDEAEKKNKGNNTSFNIYEIEDRLLLLSDEITKINKKIEELLNNKNKLINKLNFSNNSENEIIIISLIHLYKRISDFKLYLENFYKNVKNSYLSLTEELIIFSFFNSKIKEFLDFLNLLSQSLRFKKENAGQPYIPSPLLNRRFRLYNLQERIKSELKRTIKDFVEKNEKFFKKQTQKKIAFLLTSEFDVNDSVYRNSVDTALIRGSFFWREMARYYPIILHELLHKVFYFLKDNHIKNLYELASEIHEILTAKKFQKNIKTPFLTQDALSSLTEDLIVDLMTFLIFGDAYILSFLLQGALGHRYYETLVKEDEKKTIIDYLSRKEENKNLKIKFEYLQSELNFQPKRDTTLIRIKFLFKIRKLLKERNQDNKNLNIIDNDLEFAIKQYINDLFPIFGKEDNPYILSNSQSEKGKFLSRTFSFSAEQQKVTINLIKEIVNLIVDEYYIKVKRFIDRGDIKFIGNFLNIYIEKEKKENKSENEIEFFIIKNEKYGETNEKNEERKDTGINKNDIFKVFSPIDKDYVTITKYEENSKDKTSEENLKDKINVN
ncbi:MAG: hypothetical protein DSY53_02455, partial [Persephonella sp.]